MPVTRLLYRSDSELTGSDRAVRESALAIADASRLRNARDDVSGGLMFAGGVFVQLLEGDGPAVEATFERICRDGRHRRLQLLDFSITDERAFASWQMVAFEGDAHARSLFPSLAEATSFNQRNRMSANTVIALMQTLLAKRTTRPRMPGVNWMVATGVME